MSLGQLDCRAEKRKALLDRLELDHVLAIGSLRFRVCHCELELEVVEL